MVCKAWLASSSCVLTPKRMENSGYTCTLHVCQQWQYRTENMKMGKRYEPMLRRALEGLFTLVLVALEACHLIFQMVK